MKWAVYAMSIIDEFLVDKPGHQVICTFDKIKDASEYIKKSRLKRKTRMGREFKCESLLSSYKRPYIDEYTVEHPPHEPPITWKVTSYASG